MLTSKISELISPEIKIKLTLLRNILSIELYQVDLMAYGTGVIKVQDDGRIDHIPFTEVAVL